MGELASSNYGAELENEVNQGVDIQNSKKKKGKKKIAKNDMGRTPTLKHKELSEGMDQEKSENPKKAMLQNLGIFSKDRRITEIKDDS